MVGKSLEEVNEFDSFLTLFYDSSANGFECNNKASLAGYE
jgi:hypothetical protein